MKRWTGILLAVVLLFTLLPITAQATDLEVNAKSAVLIDLATGTVLYEQNSHTALPPASVTKVMTMLLVMEAIDDGRIQWQDTVTASENAAAKGGSQIFLKVGETMSVEEMLKSVAVSSANDCACALAEHIYGSESAFVEMMNQRAAELGMQDTHFVNCTGLDDDPNAQEHRTSAYDIARMSRELLTQHPEIKKYTTIWMDTVRNGAFGLSNTNKLVRFYQGATGLKTGFTSEAGYCLSASAMREDMELVAVVLGCETSSQRFSACKTMLDYGFANYATVRPEMPGTATVPVVLGNQDSVTAVPGSQNALLIDKSQRSQISTKIELDPQVNAPVSKGQRLGTLHILSGEQTIAQVPLLAEESVAKLTYPQLFLKVLKRLSMAK